jgi:hypothetical protein
LLDCTPPGNTTLVERPLLIPIATRGGIRLPFVRDFSEEHAAGLLVEGGPELQGRPLVRRLFLGRLAAEKGFAPTLNLAKKSLLSCPNKLACCARRAHQAALPTFSHVWLNEPCASRCGMAAQLSCFPAVP